MIQKKKKKKKEFIYKDSGTTFPSFYSFCLASWSTLPHSFHFASFPSSVLRSKIPSPICLVLFQSHEAFQIRPFLRSHVEIALSTDLSHKPLQGPFYWVYRKPVHSHVGRDLVRSRPVTDSLSWNFMHPHHVFPWGADVCHGFANSSRYWVGRYLCTWQCQCV
jgi:hypothetical protein